MSPEWRAQCLFAMFVALLFCAKNNAMLANLLYFAKVTNLLFVTLKKNDNVRFTNVMSLRKKTSKFKKRH